MRDFDIVDLTELAGQNCSSSMHRASQNLGRFYTELNHSAWDRQMGGSLIAATILNTDIGHASKGPSGWSFIQMIFPFISKSKAITKRYPAKVSPLDVLGWSSKWLPEHINPTDIDACVKKFQSQYEFEGGVPPSYWWFRQLGLMVAQEGKNRVAFMRHHQQPYIAAWVKEYEIPSPERLKILPPMSDDRICADQWFLLLDGQELAYLQYPAISSWYLSMYGVEASSWNVVASSCTAASWITAEILFSKIIQISNKPHKTGKVGWVIDLALLSEQILKEAAQNSEQENDNLSVFARIMNILR